MDRPKGLEQQYSMGESASYSTVAVHGSGSMEYELWFKLREPINTVRGLGLIFSSERQMNTFLRETIRAGEIPGVVKVDAEAYKTQLAREISTEAGRRIDRDRTITMFFQSRERMRLNRLAS